MRQTASRLALLALLMLLGGCATKIDLYEYRDVSSVNVVDRNQADYIVERPTLDTRINVENHTDPSYTDVVRDAFLQANSRKRIFDITDRNATYRVTISLYNLSHTRSYIPPVYIKTDKGGYYTKAYWSYRLSCSMGAELANLRGSAEYFEADFGDSFTLEANRYNHYRDVTRDNSMRLIRRSTDGLLAKIGNAVAPEGLIISKKVHIDDEEEMIFLINMGRSEGLSPEQTVLVYKTIVFKNQIDARTDASQVFIGKGTVSNQVSSHRAWIVMDDEDLNTKVDIGDTIRAVYR